ncbi:putative pyrroloquinoline-quinone binding quinoprotein [Dyadobacter jejuensis]|uniref:Putative pyrroloquinoline-quinone binding quinoprotein n=2 Tax=Dyadobacter jejuensis TaxID=1082580 RepID=A0A316AQ62_9BACT|nr:putative pyrroloquinoline-quinone binding quinoprotein [Dyadobacter jejuensis]
MTRKLILPFFVQLSVLLLSCSPNKVQTKYDHEGVVTQLPYLWRSSISDGTVGTKLYLGYTIKDNSILCEIKQKSTISDPNWESSIALKSVKTGKDIWIWNDLFDKELIRTLNDDIVIENDKIWIHDLMADYCIDARDGKTIWKTLRTFPSYSEACNIGDQYFFAANGIQSSLHEKRADSFFRYLINGKGFIEIGQPLYSDRYKSSNNNYFGSIKNITAFSRDKSDFLVVPFVEQGPATGSSANYNPIQTFYGLFNITEGVWIYERIPLSEKEEGGIMGIKPIIQGDKVYLTSAAYVYCFNVLNGEQIWKKKLTNDFSAVLDMILAEDKLLLNLFNAKLYCVDAQTGKLLWTQKSSGISGDLYHQNGVVYWIPLGNLRAVDLETGKLLWNLDTIERESVKSNKSEWHGFVTGIPGKNGEKGKIFATSDHYLYCFEAIR